MHLHNLQLYGSFKFNSDFENQEIKEGSEEKSTVCILNSKQMQIQGTTLELLDDQYAKLFLAQALRLGRKNKQRPKIVLRCTLASNWQIAETNERCNLSTSKENNFDFLTFNEKRKAWKGWTETQACFCWLNESRHWLGIRNHFFDFRNYSFSCRKKIVTTVSSAKVIFWNTSTSTSTSSVTNRRLTPTFVKKKPSLLPIWLLALDCCALTQNFGKRGTVREVRGPRMSWHCELMRKTFRHPLFWPNLFIRIPCI